MTSDPVAAREDLPVAAIRRRLGELRLRDGHRLERKLDRLRHQRDPQVRSRDLTRLLAEIEQGESIVARQRAAVPTVSYPEQLPVSARRDDLLAAIRDHQVVVVAGETGSGKTTQLPKICLELGRGIRGQIAHTQPRRIAARTVAERIADELGVGLGEAIGYSVRFNDRSGDDTLVRLMTDGLLLAELQRDRLLRRYDTIIIDEAHERSLNIDFLLGQLKQILPRRPDLKLIITSATIDPERFATHFADADGDPAPIIEVSGRTYPVEVRYRPVIDPDDPDADPDRDQTDAICDAVEELAHEPEGDVLVFLSGEREIRDTAEALNGRFGGGKRSGAGARGLQILPLYARLSTAEQQKVFRRSSGDTARRVVLATNVAETSLTVPGIKYVVDPGNARISRYSAKLKVQRLPIERISQASANQRKGRCGRTSDGICIRLYSEDDFEERAEYTDPEILRTNLASVILQMAALGLGEVADFPFLEPPDRAQVRDGVMLLHELGALDPAAEDPKKRLTALGRKLARLPIDPRMGRMVLEADRLGVTEEVVVIAAALSIQDPRERPTDKQEAAAQSHVRFKHPKSDFLGFLNLWEYLGRQQRELSGSQFRKTCKQEFLHYLRIREWQDLVAQLRQAAKQVGITVPRTHGRGAPAPADGEPADVPRAEQQIHISLLSGLLSHLGLKDETQKKDQRGRDKQRGGQGGRDRNREYLGARGARFQIFPGSALAKKPPTWTMVAELVETSRLWGRTAAEIQPEWVEPLAEHLLKRTYAEPRWSRKRASVVASERATLYGLPIVAGRTVQYGKLDPVVSRELFIQHALVEGDWDGRHRFIEQNRALIAEIEALEERARRRGILVEDDAIYAFFDERIPEDVVSGAHFDTWWKRQRQRTPDLLTFPRSLLIEEQAADAVGPQGRMAMPDAWKQGDHLLPLSYRFEPGTDDDGVTVHVPLTLLPQIKPVGFEWLVPGLRQELVTALVRALPKEIRRELVPIPDTVARVLERVTPRSAPLPVALARELNELPGVQVSPKLFDLTALPPHLRIRFAVEDESGKALAEGHDLDALREAVRPKLKAKLQAATPDLERRGLTSWSFGTLPRAIGVANAGGDAGGLRVYPALVDEGETVGIRSLDTPDAQATAMKAGIRRLLLLTVNTPERYVRGKLDMQAQLSLTTAPHGSVDAVIADTIAATVDGLAASKGGVAWNEAEFKVLREHVAGNLADAAVKVLQQVVRILDAEREVRSRLERFASFPTAPGSAFEIAHRDVTAQLRRLIFPDFVTATGARRLPDIVRYLQAAAYRLDRLPDQKAADADRTRAIHELEAAYKAKLDSLPPGRPPSAELREVRWMLEELRVNQFAQTLTRQRGGLPISAKRIRKTLDGA